MIAIYGCRGDSKGLLENSIGMQLRLNLYKGVGADKLSADVVKQEKETSYAYGVALVTGVPLQVLFILKRTENLGYVLTIGS